MTRRVLVVGAGEAGQLIAEALRDEEYQREVVGFLDDATELQGSSWQGIPVLGSTAEMARVARDLKVDEIILAIPSASGSQARRLVVAARRTGRPVRIVPGLRDIIKGTVRFEQVREISPEDLLGRQTVDLDEGPIRQAVQGKEVLVTGAGGSIGSELCRLLSAFEPAKLWLLGRGENSLFEIEEELRDGYEFDRTQVVLADIRDGDRLRHLASTLRPQVVLHAAAHKHVPLMEMYPEEAVMVNVVGTSNLLAFAREVGTSRFVMLSTDKAVSPRNVMGATKRVAELLVQSAAQQGGGSFTAVRFGNVLGSRGSVVPIFQRQLRRGGPLTVTNRSATRYFMTIREAAMLVIQAMAGGKGGEVFVLDMGEAINIGELAENLIALAGLEGEGIEIVETGLRPGEKLQERYLAETEPTVSGPHPQILVARPALPSGFDPVSVVRRFRELATACDREGIRRELAQLIPDHESNGRDRA